MCHLRPHVLHCIQYKCLNPVKARLLVLLSNSLTFPLTIPLPVPHQCCCKFFFQAPALVSSLSLSANDFTIYPAENIEAMKYNFHHLLSFPSLCITYINLHSAYYKMALLLISQYVLGLTHCVKSCTLSYAQATQDTDWFNFPSLGFVHAISYSGNSFLPGKFQFIPQNPAKMLPLLWSSHTHTKNNSLSTSITLPLYSAYRALTI